MQILSFRKDSFSDGARCAEKQKRSYESYLPCEEWLKKLGVPTALKSIEG